MFKKVVALVLACSMIFMLAACGGAATGTTTAAGGDAPETNGGSDAETIKVGVLLPLSGANATAGEYQLEGIQLCVDYVNAHGGIKSMNGAQINLVICDSTGDVEVGGTEMERLISVENVSAIVGPYNSGVAAATAPVAIQNGVPYVITNAIADNIMQSTENKYVYRSNYGAADMAPFRGLVMDYLASLTDSGKIEKIAIVYDQGDWGTGDFESISKIADEKNIEVVVAEAITTDSSDLSSVVNKIKNSGAEFVFASIFLSDAILFTQQMKEYQCDAQIVGAGAGFCDVKYLEAFGEDANEILATSDFSPSFGTKSEEAAEYYKEYLEKHDDVMMPLETTNGWCGMGTVIEALEAAGSSDRDAIADALYNLDLDGSSIALWYSMFDGINFNTEGDELGRFNQNTECGETAGQILRQIQDGKWELVWPLENKTADIIYK